MPKAASISSNKAMSGTRVVVSATARMNHAPSLSLLADGRWFACWYSGTGEARPDVTIQCATGDPEGLAWDAPRTLVAAGEQAAGAARPPDSLGNPVASLASDGRLWLIYGVIECADEMEPANRGWRCGRIDARWSADHGESWSPSVRLVARKGALPRGRPLQSDLGLLAPIYLEGAWTCCIARIPPTNPCAATLTAQIGPDILQPVLIAGGDGAVRAYFRDRKYQRVKTALYDLGSDRWGELQTTNLPNPDSAVDALVLPDGRILLIYNPSTTDRDRLALAFSLDGVRFTHGALIAEGPGALAYPAIALTPQGALLALYSARGRREIIALRLSAEELAACAAIGL